MNSIKIYAIAETKKCAHKVSIQIIPNETIESLKRYVACRLRLSFNLFRLVLETGEVVSDDDEHDLDRTINSYGIGDNYHLFVEKKPRIQKRPPQPKKKETEQPVEETLTVKVEETYVDDTVSTASCEEELCLLKVDSDPVFQRSTSQTDLCFKRDQSIIN